MQPKEPGIESAIEALALIVLGVLVLVAALLVAKVLIIILAPLIAGGVAALGVAALVGWARVTYEERESRHRLVIEVYRPLEFLLAWLLLAVIAAVILR
ncbi:putative L-lactate permease [Pyrolobus fumarii 1A]|uniref:Putative L-lactate permease n=1 Tax=Pyrolobus fumarii (strain DSM 11204 / 1A) TaxID=694429 RepID=G0EFD7_PYRF1|nr:hypothetical protein [Pyrolobus fumarii]AEM38180.1 putative L-lactate permease [Pyrolobus fumarii 1A]